MKDLLVIGGGPAGLATALYAVRSGLDVAVWEKRAGVVDKACGEGLMPGAVAALADLGVEPSGEALHGIRYLAGRRTVEAAFRAGPGRGVRRTTLHAAMQVAAERAGVVTEPRAAHDLRQGPDGVMVDGERFGHVVAADGLHSRGPAQAGPRAAGHAPSPLRAPSPLPGRPLDVVRRGALGA